MISLLAALAAQRAQRWLLIPALMAACSAPLVACGSSTAGEGGSTAVSVSGEVTEPTETTELDTSVDSVAVDSSAVDSSAVDSVVVDSSVVDSSVTDPVVEPGAVVPEGFTTVTVEVTKADGEVCEVCMWLADNSAERGQGLMGVTSLGQADGMAFVWDEPTMGSFFMFRTIVPLSIAWFAPTTGDDGGALVSTADMAPCTSEDSEQCERYPSSGEFTLAIEVLQGDLASIGIGAGASARVVPGTEAASCSLVSSS